MPPQVVLCVYRLKEYTGGPGVLHMWESHSSQSTERINKLVRRHKGGSPRRALVRVPPWSDQVGWSLWSNHPLVAAYSSMINGQNARQQHQLCTRVTFTVGA